MIIQRLENYNAFTSLNEVSASIIAGVSQRTEREVLIVADPLRIEEVVYFDEELGFKFNHQGFEYVRRRGKLPTVVYLTLAYNVGVPRMISKDRVTENTRDELVIAAYPNAIEFAHVSQVCGSRAYSHEQEMPYDALLNNPEVVSDAVWGAFLDNPPLLG